LRSSDVLLINSLVLRTTAPTRWPASNWIPRCPFSASTSGAKKIHGRQKAGRDSLDFGPVFPSSESKSNQKVPECDLARPLTWLSGGGSHVAAVLLLEGP
jgi:hypothetical protein